MKKRPYLENEFEKFDSLNGIWKTIQSLQESFTAVLGSEIAGVSIKQIMPIADKKYNGKGKYIGTDFFVHLWKFQRSSNVYV